MLRTYINTYDSSEHTLDALVDALTIADQTRRLQEGE
jgi:hypothetical protein